MKSPQQAGRVARFWKPYGVLSQFTDPEGRPTLADYIDMPGIYAAGRLDFDSEGLLILSDSGSLIARLTSPTFRHPKIYLVQVERLPDAEALSQLRRGVLLRDGWTLPAQVSLLAEPPALPDRDPPIRFRKAVPTAWLRLTIREGRNRQVRRMTAAVGHPALRLVRERVGPVGLDGLAPGGWELLSPQEVKALWRALLDRESA